MNANSVIQREFGENNFKIQENVAQTNAKSELQ